MCCCRFANVPVPASSQMVRAVVARAGSRRWRRPPAARCRRTPGPSAPRATPHRLARAPPGPPSARGPGRPRPRAGSSSGSPVARNVCRGAPASSRSQALAQERGVHVLGRLLRAGDQDDVRARAPTGAGRTAAGSACSPGSRCRCPPLATAQDTCARPPATRRSVVSPRSTCSTKTGQATREEPHVGAGGGHRAVVRAAVDRGLRADQPDRRRCGWRGPRPASPGSITPTTGMPGAGRDVADRAHLHRVAGHDEHLHVAVDQQVGDLQREPPDLRHRPRVRTGSAPCRPRTPAARAAAGRGSRARR